MYYLLDDFYFYNRRKEYAEEAIEEFREILEDAKNAIAELQDELKKATCEKEKDNIQDRIKHYQDWVRTAKSNIKRYTEIAKHAEKEIKLLESILKKYGLI